MTVEFLRFWSISTWVRRNVPRFCYCQVGLKLPTSWINMNQQPLSTTVFSMFFLVIPLVRPCTFNTQEKVRIIYGGSANEKNCKAPMAAVVWSSATGKTLRDPVTLWWFHMISLVILIDLQNSTDRSQCMAGYGRNGPVAMVIATL